MGKPVARRGTIVSCNQLQLGGAARGDHAATRVVPHARGHGFATEAAEAVLNEAANSFHGEILAFMDPTNQTSERVALKLGFLFWKQAQVEGYLDNVYRLQIGGEVKKRT